MFKDHRLIPTLKQETAEGNQYITIHNIEEVEYQFEKVEMFMNEEAAKSIVVTLEHNEVPGTADDSKESPMKQIFDREEPSKVNVQQIQLEQPIQ